MKSKIPYRFNIINNEKPNSQFNYGGLCLDMYYIVME